MHEDFMNVVPEVQRRRLKRFVRVPKLSPFRRSKQSRVDSFDGSECIL